AIRARAAAQLERCRVEERRARLGGIREECAARAHVPREIDQQRRGERSVHDEAGIALDVHGPRTIVVDAVTVEGEGGEPEEENRLRLHASAPRHIGGRVFASWRLVALAGLDLLTKDRAPLLLDGEASRPEDAARHRREHQRAGSARLHRQIRQLGLAAELVTDQNGAMKADALAGEHASWQRHRWNHAGFERAAVGAELARTETRQEVEEMPARR